MAELPDLDIGGVALPQGEGADRVLDHEEVPGPGRAVGAKERRRRDRSKGSEMLGFLGGRSQTGQPVRWWVRH